MNVCRTDYIPCPFALVEWSELPCFADHDQCKNWREQVQQLPFEDPSITLAQFRKKAKELISRHWKKLTVSDVYQELKKIDDEFTVKHRD